MKTTCFILLWLLLGLTFTACGQQDEIRLIVRGDDMGFSHAANEAMIDCHKNGVMTSVEVMPMTPWFPEAARLCNEYPEMDVGVHLALTSEWESMKWGPISDVPSLTDENGYFYPMVWPNDNFGPERALKENGWTLEDVEKEIRAQIELAQKNIPHISHVTTHMGFSSMDNKVMALVKQLSQEYGIDINHEDYGVKRARWEGPKDTSEQKVGAFLKMLEGLEPGNTYLFVDHPGYNTPELKGIHHVGYETVAQDRQGVTDAWTDERVKAAIKKYKVRLISYAELKQLAE